MKITEEHDFDVSRLRFIIELTKKDLMDYHSWIRTPRDNPSMPMSEFLHQMAGLARYLEQKETTKRMGRGYDPTNK